MRVTELAVQLVLRTERPPGQILDTGTRSLFELMLASLRIVACDDGEIVAVQEDARKS